MSYNSFRRICHNSVSKICHIYKPLTTLYKCSEIQIHFPIINVTLLARTYFNISILKSFFADLPPHLFRHTSYLPPRGCQYSRNRICHKFWIPTTFFFCHTLNLPPHPLLGNSITLTTTSIWNVLSTNRLIKSF